MLATPTTSVERRMLLPSYHFTSLDASQRIISEQGRLWLTLQTCIQETLGSDLIHDTGYLDCSISRFSQSLQATSGRVPQFESNCFLPNPFHFILYLPSDTILLRY
jgi:hypothetical protein